MINNWFKRPFSLRIYMRSGNCIEIDGITDYTLNNRGDTITGIQLEQSLKARNRLLVKTIALEQIEAVVKVR